MSVAREPVRVDRNIHGFKAQSIHGFGGVRQVGLIGFSLINSGQSFIIMLWCCTFRD